MSMVRQDAWSSDEDLILAEVVLRHIREGSTQLAAFEEVGERLSRTAAACGFRWNSAIRKKYEAAISLAKKQRKKAQRELVDDQSQLHAVEAAAETNVYDKVEASGIDLEQTSSEEKEVSKGPSTNRELTFDDVISFLQTQRDEAGHELYTINENNELRKQVEALQRENDELKARLHGLEKDNEVINEDYKALIGIMERARKMAIIDEAPSKQERVKR
ncbi:RsfA family transcriptional regulator [Desertibacillus haloalkaliphilus]|uniref:RsfA family transcriptional regulator n=1 Tax=Desertibacillus haloalkaliphilus TaxID=1328930 RepID=UPI001C27FFF8|nr:RsfA family transcriptional regulator [Desertibacillus haloalkaliphilus]MBU8907125.1 RsfA family transcriptional regulator [Desertibacillus haloalkaliphilus]